MFKNDLSPKGRRTRERIRDTAVRLFRTRGFDETTMRDIAREAGLSVGAAYHYYPGKEAIVLAYYEAVQRRHAERVGSELDGLSPTDRVGRALTLKLEILAEDRSFLGALLRYAGVPGHALSFVGSETRELRAGSVAAFREALRPLRLGGSAARTAPVLLWALHMGLLLYFVHDDSPGRRRSHELAERAGALFAKTGRLLGLPGVRRLSGELAELMDDYGLAPTGAAGTDARPGALPGGARAAAAGANGPSGSA